MEFKTFTKKEIEEMIDHLEELEYAFKGNSYIGNKVKKVINKLNK